MEEVDKILIITLNQLGCDLDESVKSIKDFGIPEVISSVTRCLRNINGTDEVPGSLPQNMAQRFRVAATIAQAIKDTGYPGDVGYQSLLYPNDSDMRKILMYLVEKLPKETATVSDEPINKASMIHREVKMKLKNMNQWIPPICRNIVHAHATNATSYNTYNCRHFHSKPYSSSKMSQAKQQQYEKYMRRVTNMLGRDYVLASLINSHAIQLEQDRTSTDHLDKEETMDIPELIPLRLRKTPMKCDAADQSLLSSFGSYKELLKTSDEDLEGKTTKISSPGVATSTEEQAKLREERLLKCQKDVADLSKDIENCIKFVEDTESRFNKMKDEIVIEDKLHEEKCVDLKTKQRTASLIPDSETNIQKLQTAIKNSHEKMLRLQQQWDDHKKPLDEQLATLNSDVTLRKGSKEQLRAKMTELREKMRLMVQDASRKEAMLAQLKTQCENMNKDINRSVYTKRIIDISAKVRKQKEEIDRVLVDTRTIQKEINSLSGKLERTFTVAENLAFKEAGSNDRARQVYRAVAAVHEGCGDLVEIIRETGTVQREIADLKEQVDLEKSKKVEETLNQLKNDLQQVKKENATLKQQIS